MRSQLMATWRPAGVPGTGTYSVNPDCTGTQTIVIPGNPDLHVQFIVAQSGNTIHQVVTDPGVATTAEGERLHSPAVRNTGFQKEGAALD